jgi:hypothetical protein
MTNRIEDEPGTAIVPTPEFPADVIGLAPRADQGARSGTTRDRRR